MPTIFENKNLNLSLKKVLSMSVSNYLLYEAYGNADATLDNVEVHWINKPSVLLLNQPYTFFIDVYVPSTEGLPVSNFCPKLLLPNLLRLSMTHHNANVDALQYSEDLVLKETSRLGRFAFSFAPTTVGRFNINLAYQQTAVWSCQVHILDSWSSSDKAEIDGPLLHARVPGGFFGQRTLDNRAFFIVFVSEPCYVGVADISNKTKTWSTQVNSGFTKAEIVDKQLNLLTHSHLGSVSSETADVKTIRIELKQFFPYIKLRQGQEARFINLE